ncbi:MAG: hypothetical protein A2139_11850 [Desulfobacca sp. RBG_16_60_12]|nr:MAG: hypothetical protein A2139_11850 [Desulfobacca sp. RBG_16_60_12]
MTAVTFALGLAVAAQAQVAKTPEKPAVQSTQEVQPQVTPKEATKPGEPVAKEAAKPVVKETVKPGDKTKEAAKTGDKGKIKQVTKKAEPKGPIEKKAGADLEKTKEGAK